MGEYDAYDQDGLKSVHNHEFLLDERFIAAYQRGVKATGLDYGWHWRVHLGLWAAHTAARLPGDFVECGVNRGFLSSSIMQYLDWDRTGKQYFLLDTFRGMDRTYISEAEAREGIVEKNDERIRSGEYVIGSEDVRRNFSEWRNVTIIEGPIPETLHLITAKQVAFLHLDLNNALPEVAAVEFLWDSLVSGALVLLDDYAYVGYHQQKAAMDRLAQHLGVAIASLPTGQGLLIKS